MLPVLLRDIGVVLFSIGLISAAYELLIRQQLLEDLAGAVRAVLEPDNRRLGIVGLYRSRDEKSRGEHGVDDLISATRADMFCVGLGLLAFVPERQARLIERINDGCHFRFLMFDPESDAATVLDRSLGDGSGSRSA